MTLQARADGALLALPSGALMAECCCGGTPTVDCNSCAPPLAASYTLTITGGTPPMSRYDGVHTLDYVGSCTWRLPSTTKRIELSWQLTHWLIVAEESPFPLYGTCLWRRFADACSPTGTFWSYGDPFCAMQVILS